MSEKWTQNQLKAWNDKIKSIKKPLEFIIKACGCLVNRYVHEETGIIITETDYCTNHGKDL